MARPLGARQRIGDELLVVGADFEHTVLLSELTDYVLGLCDGATRVAQVVGQVASRWPDLGYPELAVEMAIEDLLAHNLLEGGSAQPETPALELSQGTYPSPYRNIANSLNWSRPTSAPATPRLAFTHRTLSSN